LDETGPEKGGTGQQGQDFRAVNPGRGGKTNSVAKRGRGGKKTILKSQGLYYLKFVGVGVRSKHAKESPAV